MSAWLLVYAYPKLLFLILGAFALLALFALPAFWDACRQAGLGRRGLLGAAAVTALALGLRLGLGVPEHRVVFDEFEFMNAAENLARRGALAESLGRAPGWDMLVPISRAGSFIAALSLPVGLGADPARAAFALSLLSSLLLVPAVYLAAGLRWRGEAAGLGAAALAALDPAAALFARSGDSMLFSAFCLASAWALREAFLVRESRSLLAAFAVGGAFAAHARPESAAVLVLLWLPLAMRGRAERAGALVFLLLAAPLALLWWSNAARGIDGYSVLIGAGRFAANLRENLSWLAAAGFGFWLLFPAALAGALRGPRQSAPALAVAGLLLLLFSAHPQNRMAAGAESRYAVPVHLALSVAGAGGAALAVARPGAAVALAGAYALSRPLPAPSGGGGPARDVELLRRALGELPPDAVVIAHNPPAALAAGAGAAASPRLLVEEPWPAALEGRPLLLWRDWAWAFRRELSRQAEQAVLARGYRPQGRWERPGASLELYARPSPGRD